MFAYCIFKVIYAPHKAFKEIIQNPNYYGPILIMVLFIAANMGSAYLFAVKTYIETTEPSPSLEKLDLWTENSTFWVPLNGANYAENFTDYIAGSCYGNRSIEFWVEQSDRIAMELHGIEVNCSVAGGYTKVYLRIKLVGPESLPQNVSLYLYSRNGVFYRDITSEFSNGAINVWNNLSIPLADEKWRGNTDWGNVTGLKLEFMWTQTLDTIRVFIDGLFFGGIYKPYVESVPAYLGGYAAYSFMRFFLRWFLLGGMIYILTKAFKAKTAWRVSLTLAGFTLITMVVQAVVGAAAFSALPVIKYPFELVGGVKGEAETAYSKLLEEAWLVNQAYNIAQIIMLVWTVVLCTIAIHLMAEFSWTTSFLAAFVAYFVAVFIESFLAM
ncbi:MAG: hypothetical protein QXL77_06765 [Candidatus Bathyarchaeia archaeon]